MRCLYDDRRRKRPPSSRNEGAELKSGLLETPSEREKALRTRCAGACRARDCLRGRPVTCTLKLAPGLGAFPSLHERGACLR